MPDTYAEIRIRIHTFDQSNNCYPTEATLHDGSHFDGGQFFQPDQKALLNADSDPAGSCAREAAHTPGIAA